MVVLTDKDREFLKRHFKDAQNLLNAENYQDILDPIYDLIDENGFAPPKFEDYNDFGRQAQKVYDRIYLNNVKQ